MHKTYKGKTRTLGNDDGQGDGGGEERNNHNGASGIDFVFGKDAEPGDKALLLILLLFGSSSGLSGFGARDGKRRHIALVGALLLATSSGCDSGRLALPNVGLAAIDAGQVEELALTSPRLGSSIGGALANALLRVDRLHLDVVCHFARDYVKSMDLEENLAVSCWGSQRGPRKKEMFAR